MTLAFELDVMKEIAALKAENERLKADLATYMKDTEAKENRIIDGEFERERCAKIVDGWLHRPTLKLMTKQEVRSVTAVLNGIRSEIRNPTS